jgi:CRP-like cAMP-binding protein
VEGALLACLGPGEVFGEKALLTHAPRTANVRAKTAVDVLVLTRPGFSALVQQFQPLEDFFGELMHRRYPELLADKEALKPMVASAMPPKAGAVGLVASSVPTAPSATPATVAPPV